VQAQEAQRLEIERQVRMKHALQETKADRVRREREGAPTDAALRLKFRLRILLFANSVICGFCCLLILLFADSSVWVFFRYSSLALPLLRSAESFPLLTLPLAAFLHLILFKQCLFASKLRTN
jgi:hypothetical protein